MTSVALLDVSPCDFLLEPLLADMGGAVASEAALGEELEAIDSVSESLA
jgi:hypothetical protein